MTTELIILVIVVLTALAFDFTNGFHDTGNAMATSIATGALKPKTAVALSASLNLVGAFLSVEVARSVGSGIVNLDRIDVTTDGPALMLIVFTGPGWRYPLECFDLASGSSLLLVARSVWWPDRFGYCCDRL